MINSFFRQQTGRLPNSSTSIPSSHSIPSRTFIQKVNSKHRKYKLLSLVLSRATQRCLRQAWQQLWQPERRTLQTLSKMITLSEKNLTHTFYLSFDKLKRAATLSRNSERLLKGTTNLLQRIEKYKLKQSFAKLLLHAFRSSRQTMNNFYEQRNYNFCRKLATMLRRHKQNTMAAMFSYARFVKSYSKVRVIAVIHNRFQRGLKQTVFAKLQRYLLAKASKPQNEREVRELKLQLQDMTVQLQNKNQNIQRLEDQLNQIKVEQSNLSFNQNQSHGESIERNKKGSFKSYSLKKFNLNDSNKSHNDSADNISIGDMSIGSLLGNLNRSRNGSVSKYDPSIDCGCGYRQKYVKYKSLNESLKNQLQIVKEELEVAKDLNQHFTNQIKQYLSGYVGDGEFDRLKRQHKLLTEERDQLREKVFKYQKYISSLKSEFKVKMEELYRKVRKDM